MLITNRIKLVKPNQLLEITGPDCFIEPSIGGFELFSLIISVEAIFAFTDSGLINPVVLRRDSNTEVIFYLNYNSDLGVYQSTGVEFTGQTYGATTQYVKELTKFWLKGELIVDDLTKKFAIFSETKKVSLPDEEYYPGILVDLPLEPSVWVFPELESRSETRCEFFITKKIATDLEVTILDDQICSYSIFATVLGYDSGTAVVDNQNNGILTA